MNIEYKYEIVSVNEAAKAMEVIYTSDGNPTMHIGTRIPFEGESLEYVIQTYAPISYWKELKIPNIPVTVGQSGNITVSAPTVDIPDPSELPIMHRNQLLLHSDWTQLPDVPLPVEKKTEWAVYRQLLRDITLQPDFPTNIVWPTKPV